MAEVTLEQVVKTYPRTDKSPAYTAVKGISLSIRDGEFMVLVGPSGCGKSTTLRMIAGLEEVTAGTVRIGGRVVNDVQPKDRDIAMVFQNYALYPHMDVRANLGFGLRLRGVAKPEIDRRVAAAAEMLGLAPLLDRKPKALSGGQRQRVALGRAIVRHPQAFLFDEPLSNLDAKMRASTRAEIAKLHRKLGSTMIYVTHDQVEAMTLGQRICVMKDGEIMQVDEPLALYERPANVYTAGFIGSPPMNFLRGRARRNADGWSLLSDAEGVPLTLALGADLHAPLTEAQPVVVGIRPEHLEVLPFHGGAGTTGARVEMVEAMGAETFVHASIGRHTLVARCAPSVRLAVGQLVGLTPLPNRAHLFDAGSERRLS